MKRLISTVLAAVVAIGVFAGCGSSAGQTQQPPAETQSNGGNTAPAETNTSGKKQTVTFLDTNPFPERTEFLEKAVSDFNASNENIEVKLDSVPWDEAYKKIVAMGASKTLPDVITGDVGIMLTLARAGWIADIGQLFEELPQTDFSSAILSGSDAYTFNDKIYAVPEGYLCQGIFVRTDWFKDAGIDVAGLENWTWDDYYDIINKMTDKANNRYGIAFRGGNNGNLRLYEYMVSNLEVGSAFPDGTSTSIFEDPRALDLFKQFFAPYMNNEAPTDSINWGFKEMVEGFLNGQCATLNQTPEVALTCQGSMEPGTWKILRQPVKSGAEKNYMTFGYTSAYMISAESKAADGAAEFVKYISQPDINTEYCIATGSLPIYQSGLQNEFFQSDNMKPYADQLLDPKISYASQPTELSQWGYFLSEFGKLETQKYMSGKQTAEETLANIAAWMKENYEKDVLNQ